MFKYELNQTVYYMMNNKVHSAPVLSRVVVENLKEEFSSKSGDTFAPFGSASVKYGTCHDIFEECELASSKENLLKLL